VVKVRSMIEPEGWEVEYISRVRLRIVNLKQSDEDALTHIECLLEQLIEEKEEDG